MAETIENKIDWALCLAFFLLCIGIIFLFFPYEILNGYGLFGYYINIKEFGELGSFVGGITTPFLSIAAFILLYRTYTSQKKELLATRKIMEIQTQTLETQQFETTFFNMLSFHNSIVNGLTFEIYEKGEDCIKRLKRIFFQVMKDTPPTTDSEGREVEAELERITYAYFTFEGEYGNILGKYFRNLLSILKIIDQVKTVDKEKYLDIISAQLSVSEQVLVFYMRLGTNYVDFRNLFNKYPLYNNLEPSELFNLDHITLYDYKFE